MAVPMALLCLIILGGGSSAWWFTNKDPATKTAASLDRPHQENADRIGESTEAPGVAAIVDPTTGSSISMDFLPVVPQLVLHLRPAEIWADESSRRELTGTLDELGIWLGEFIQQTTRFAPAEIEELTIAVNFGARSSVPDVAAVAHLKQAQRETRILLNRILGTRIPDLAADVYESDGLAFLIIDEKTIAVSSLELAEDLVEAAEYAAVPQPEMESLLQASDRSHHVTLIADLQVLSHHRELVLKSQLHQLTEDALLWFGTDCRALSWSAHLDPHLYMETRLVRTAEATARQLHERIQKQIERLPESLLATVRTMRPATVGHRMIIGRFPAMMKATALGTQSSRSEAGTVLTTLLPHHAAANLAAGAMLTWQQSVRSGSGTTTATAAVSQPASETIALRLQRPVLVDFRREPLQAAMEYIGSEIQVSIVIDGEALKLAGFTQNMQQTHALGEVPALTAIDAILRQYGGKMVIVVDESQRTILLTTQNAANDRGLTVFDLHAVDRSQ